MTAAPDWIAALETAGITVNASMWGPTKAQVLNLARCFLAAHATRPLWQRANAPYPDWAEGCRCMFDTVGTFDDYGPDCPHHPDPERVAALNAEVAALQLLADRRLRERDAERADIDALRSALDLRMGEGLTLAEITAHVKALGVTGDHIKAVDLRIAERETAIRKDERAKATVTGAMWGQDRETQQWWFVATLDGEPFLAYHPEHDWKAAWRDTFSRWGGHAEMPMCGDEHVHMRGSGNPCMCKRFARELQRRQEGGE